MNTFYVAPASLPLLLLLVANPLMANNSYSNSWKFRPLANLEANLRSASHVAPNNRTMHRVRGRSNSAYAVSYNNHRQYAQTAGYPGMPSPMPLKPAAYQQMPMVPAPMPAAYPQMTGIRPMRPYAPAFARQLGWPARYAPYLPRNMEPDVIRSGTTYPQPPVHHRYAGQTYQFRPPQYQRQPTPVAASARHAYPAQIGAYNYPPAMAYSTPMSYAYPMMPAGTYGSMPTYSNAYSAMPASYRNTPRQYVPVVKQRRRYVSRNRQVEDLQRQPIVRNRQAYLVKNVSQAVHQQYRWRPTT